MTEPHTHPKGPEYGRVVAAIHRARHQDAWAPTFGERLARLDQALAAQGFGCHGVTGECPDLGRLKP